MKRNMTYLYIYLRMATLLSIYCKICTLPSMKGLPTTDGWWKISISVTWTSVRLQDFTSYLLGGTIQQTRFWKFWKLYHCSQLRPLVNNPQLIENITGTATWMPLRIDCHVDVILERGMFRYKTWLMHQGRLINRNAVNQNRQQTHVTRRMKRRMQLCTIRLWMNMWTMVKRR